MFASISFVIGLLLNFPFVLKQCQIFNFTKVLKKISYRYIFVNLYAYKFVCTYNRHTFRST